MISAPDIMEPRKMRALVDLRDAQIIELDRLAKLRGRSRAALIRDAVDAYLSRDGASDGEEAFGLWGGEGPDGLAFQEKLRREW